MTEPTAGMARYRCVKVVLAGRIREVVAAGCYVEQADGTAVLRTFLPNMTARYMPVAGDYWIVYEPDWYQSISPAAVFEDGYVIDPEAR